MLAGRPVKPLPFAAAMTMVCLFVFNLFDRDLIGDRQVGDVLGGFCLAVATLFCCAWVTRSQVLVRAGLLGACFVWTGRFWLAVLMVPAPFTVLGTWLSIAWAVATGGAYLLEHADSEGHRYDVIEG